MDLASNDTSEGIALMFVTVTFLERLASNIKVIVTRRSANLTRAMTNVVNQGDNLKMCAQCEEASEKLMVYYQCFEAECQSCGKYCNLCKEVWGRKLCVDDKYN
eukprot:11391476-Ditylum_brightwellii.AAC.1